MLIACENFAKANGRRMVIRETPLFRKLCEIFEFECIALEPDAPDGITAQWIHVHPFGYRFEDLGWIMGICDALARALGGTLPEQIELPAHRILPAPQREEITLVQFDGRSGGQWQRSSLLRFLRLYQGRKIAVLGGPDTGAYLGPDFEYRKGDLGFLVRQLLACGKFVGADSGIAHLACVLGLEVDILPSPSVSKALVQGIFGHYPKPPRFRSLRETRSLSGNSRRMFLISTTSGWNLGDDLIREGVLRLLEIDEDRDSVIWLNRAQVDGEDKEEKRPWSPLWMRLRNLGDRRALAENAQALIVAGTPEWIDAMQPFLRLAVTTSLPVLMVGVGGGQEGQTHHLMPLLKAECLNAATVRDEAAQGAFAEQGIQAPRFFDPAFHSGGGTLSTDGRANARKLFIFNPRLETPEQEAGYRELYRKLRGQIDMVVVHEPHEYMRAENLFDKPVYHHSDYNRMLNLYRHCGTYVGGRMHGAIPSLASGAEVHLVCHERKHREMHWLLERLDCPEALTLWEPAALVRISCRGTGQFHDQSKCIQADFEAHRSHLKKAMSSF